MLTPLIAWACAHRSLLKTITTNDRRAGPRWQGLAHSSGDCRLPTHPMQDPIKTSERASRLSLSRARLIQLRPILFAGRAQKFIADELQVRYHEITVFSTKISGWRTVFLRIGVEQKLLAHDDASLQNFESIVYAHA